MTRRPLAVTMVTGSLSRRAGGLFHSVRKLSLHLAERGVRVNVIGLFDSDTEADLEAWAPLQPVVLGATAPTSLGWAAGLTQAIEATRPDVVHQHGIWQMTSVATTRFAARGGPTVISPRGMLDPWALRNSAWKKRLAWSGWERRNLTRAACLHALAEAEAAAIRQVLPMSAIATVPNAVEIGKPLPIRKSSKKRAELLFLGRLHPKKGLPELLFQWARLQPALRDQWEIVAAGPDENGHRGDLETAAQRLGVAGDIRFVGPLSGTAKAEAFARARAFVLPSHSEGLPMAVLEAWASGLPVLMTRACNLPEGFAAGAAHEIDTGPDPVRLAAGLSRPDLAEMGLKGRALVEERFSWPSIAARQEAVYRWVLGHGKPGTDISLSKESQN
ncbi:glycosyltransferase [Thioclava sp. JE_KL1]|uniref:glycosyltransferase n=1 Tax=Thioclava sp. JE_KL1 TaxID=2651187 RepID=UPI00128D3D79|nr:glycosyltransferase [Thioclava sp. JE_KL1]MPQ95247.1 glycosyltransferase [Thioclava sp. JE_KL1]